ncbi:uncharacterized protein LOC123270327 isoform X2 [Cotesia glomerata]|uniref:uncharacterized protein LOC123270327 isoform X2 n=1 Tax=Cotesia glomerata TaxID=32391 RepID=UPI001D033484|nr:uncharacterized protein LOC123270327 isoform X2 [Cotesia glomerata]
MDGEDDLTALQPAEIDEEEKESLEAKKKKVKQQISQLQELIEDVIHQLEVVKFGDLNIDHNSVAVAVPSTSEDVNIDDKLQFELFKLSGIWCSKCTDIELVYKFSPNSNYQNLNAVQLLLDDDKIKIGKWALPWGIKIEYILRETPLDKMSQTSAFLRNCKRHIDCHEQRWIQITSLRELTEEVKNIRVEGSLGNLSMYIKLLSINNSELNLKHDMIISLFYESGEARPHLIKTNWNLKNKPDENMLLEMGKFVKNFKKYDLQEAYEAIANRDHPIFKWKPNRGENSQEINLGYEYFSDEEDEVSEEDQPKKKRKQAKKRTVKKRKEAEKSQESQEKDTLVSSENDENSPIKNNSKNKGTKSTAVKKTAAPVLKKLVASIAKKSTKSPASKKNQVDKRQTRLSFKGVPLESSDAQESPKRQEFNQRMRETSTPKTRLSDKIPLVSLVPISISPIESESSEKSNQNLNKSKQKNESKK